MIVSYYEMILYKRWFRSVRIRRFSGPYFSRIFLHLEWIRRDTPYLSVLSPSAEKCVKNADHNNSEYGLFLRSENLKGTENECFSIKIYPKSLVYLGLSQTFTMELFVKSFCKTLLSTSVYANVFFTTLHLCTENEVSH